MDNEDRVPGVIVALTDDSDPEEFAESLSERDDVIAAKWIISGLRRSEVVEDDE